MKKILILISALAILAGCKNSETQVKDNGKKAIVMVHFGTTHDTTRNLTIDAVNRQVETAFRESDVFEAYTSRIVIKRLKDRGIVKRTPIEVLDSLSDAGYKTVTLQPTHIIPGKEYQMLLAEADSMKSRFNEIKIGKPLLFSIEDSHVVAGILAARNPSENPLHHILYVGHGTDDPATAVYSQIDYIFRAQGFGNSHVATIEGYPTLDNAIDLLKKANAKKVTLVPLMFVAGDHAVNDISVEWKKALEDNGFQVELKIEGLGQIPQIRNLFINHILEAK